MMPSSRFLSCVALATLLVSSVAGAGARGQVKNREGGASQFVFQALASIATSAECAGLVIAGTHGEAITVTRSSSAYCTKSDGTMVSISANLPRVEANGLLVEASATNTLLRSSELDNATWTKAGTATVTADFANGPDGTLSADRLVYPATTGSYVLQAASVGGLSYTMSVYLKGTSSSGAIDFCRGGGASQCVICSYNSTSWTRCTHSATYATSSNVFLGCDTSTKGGACSAAGDVLVWGVQAETGAFASSYIATAGTTATRSSDAVTAAITAPSTSGGSCIAVSYIAGGAHGSGQAVLDYGVDASNRFQVSNDFGNGGACTFVSAGGNVSKSATGSVDTSAVRQVCRWDGTSGVTSAYTGATTASATGTATNFTPTTLAIGKFIPFAVSGPPMRLSVIQIGKTAGACQ